MKKISVILAFCSITSAQAAWNGKIYDARKQLEVSDSEFYKELSHGKNIVLGELHYLPEVMQAEGRIIRSVVEAAGIQGDFVTAWEFLNFTQQSQITRSFEGYRTGALDFVGFLKELGISLGHDVYEPMVNATKDLRGTLIGVNLSHADKKPILTGGLASIDPSWIPPGFEMGSEAYLERFAETMGGHASKEQVQRYFEAQCLTDDLIAFHALQASSAKMRFIVSGAFHADYFDAAVSRLTARAPDEKTVVVRFVDASFFRDNQLMALLSDAKYGPIADYVYFVNEPAQ